MLIALGGVATSIGLSLFLVLDDRRGPAAHAMITVDDFSLFFNFLFAGVAGMIVLGSVDYLRRNRFQAEYLALILASSAAMMLMAAGTT